MRALRIFAKILLFPVTLILTITVAISMFIIERLAGLLNIASGILFIGAIFSFIQYFSGWPFGEAKTAFGLQSAIIVTVFAFLFSPYGLPLFGMWIVSKLDDLNDAIKSI